MSEIIAHIIKFYFRSFLILLIASGNYSMVIMKSDGSHARDIGQVRTAYNKLGDVEKTEIIDWDRGSQGEPKRTVRTLVKAPVRAIDEPRKERKGRRR